MSLLPRVVVDARMVGEFGHGIANYVSDLAYGFSALREKSPLEYDLIYLVHGPGNHSAKLANFPVFPVRHAFLHPLENWEIPNVLTHLRADLYHSPSFSSLPFCPCPYVQTLHDLNHRWYGNILQRAYYRFLLRNFALGARKLITVSDFSRGQIAEWLGILPAEIDVVENPIRLDAIDRAAQGTEGYIREMGLKRGKYFFSLSSMKPHKNLKMLVRAYQEYRALHAQEPWPLVLPVREHAFTDPGVECVGPLSNEHAMQLMKFSGAFLFPSLYEGFGRPPLEAVSLGVPLVVSNIAPHREGLRGISSSYVVAPPDDVGAWRDAMGAAAKGGAERPGMEARSAIELRYGAIHLAEKMDLIYKQTIRRFDA